MSVRCVVLPYSGVEAHLSAGALERGLYNLRIYAMYRERFEQVGRTLESYIQEAITVIHLGDLCPPEENHDAH